MPVVSQVPDTCFGSGGPSSVQEEVMKDILDAVLLTLHPFTPTEVKGYYNPVAHNALLDGSSCPRCGIVPYIIGSLVSFMSSLH